VIGWLCIDERPAQVNNEACPRRSPLRCQAHVMTSRASGCSTDVLHGVIICETLHRPGFQRRRGDKQDVASGAMRVRPLHRSETSKPPTGGYDSS